MNLRTPSALALAAWLVPAPAPASSAQDHLGGAIYDVAGNPLARVQVMLGRAGSEVLFSQTESDGRYRFDGLMPGSYFLYASKIGYRAVLLPVNTVASTTLDLTLRLLGEPAPEGNGSSLPEDETWVLRVPARDVLRETGAAGLPVAPASAGEEAEAVDRRFRAEVQQWFSVPLGAPTSGSDLLDEGRNTAIHVDGRVAEAVGWSVEGGSQRTSAAFEEAPLRGVDAASHEVQVNVNVQPDAKNRVDISAWYDQDDQVYGVVGLDDDAGRRSQVWGYGASWSSRVGSSDVDLHLGYGVANLDALRATRLVGGPLADQQWSAVGAVSLSPGSGRALRLGMRASLSQHDSDATRLTLGPDPRVASSPVANGRRGWAVNLFGNESFEVSGPLAVDVGIDLHHLGYDQPVSFVLPQAGITYRPGRSDTLRAAVLMKLADGGGQPAGGADPPGGAASLGYLMAWERRLAGHLTVSLAAAVRPYAQERLASADYVAFDPATGQALFLSDGNATSREGSLQVETRFSIAQVSTGVRYGEARGSLISYLPNGIPSGALALDDVRFLTASVRTAFLPTGTRLSIDFQRIRNEHLWLGEVSLVPLTYTGLDVIVQQEIAPDAGRGEWSLLFGFEAARSAADEEEGAEQLARLGVPDDLRRLSTGVAVRF
jgi:hypothetical protein